MNIMDEIKHYFWNQSRCGDLSNIYTQCLIAKRQYFYDESYFFTDQDRDNLIMLASAWSALLRRAWRIFIQYKKYEKFKFWNAFISVFILSQHVLLDDCWRMIFKDDKEFMQLINKTSNPQFITKMFTGINWRWLISELNKHNTRRDN